MAHSSSAGRTTAASRRASQRTQPDTPSSDPARPPRRAAVASSPYAPKGAQAKGNDKVQKGKGTDKRASRPAQPAKRAKKDRGQAKDGGDGGAEDGEGQDVCPACGKAGKDASWVECDRCARAFAAFLSGRGSRWGWMSLACWLGYSVDAHVPPVHSNRLDRSATSYFAATSPHGAPHSALSRC